MVVQRKIESEETIYQVEGFQVSGVDAGLRKEPAPDLALIVADRPCTAAGIFTTNHVVAAPVILDKERIENHPDRIRAILINAACANACTGAQGMNNARHTSTWVAQELDCKAEEVLVMSTGVIGVQLPIDNMQAGIPSAVAALSPDGWEMAAQAIMTTDTQPKLASIQEEGITITGIAKGAGMIAPNMATMLSAIVTDAAISPLLLHKALLKAASHSFNRIVVDGDMSTNDTVLVLANGASEKRITQENLAHFTKMLTTVCTTLAHKIVRDGEGATRFIEIRVTGTPRDWEARQIANTIATSPLVKTAFYGGDANWGRILAAAGRAGVALDQGKLALWFDDLQLVAEGTPLDYDDDRANAIASQPEVTITLDLGLGDQLATVWTCDLSHDYVSINGHYRT